MRWRKLHEEKPEDGQNCLFKMKHGYIQGDWDADDEMGFSYIWKDINYYVSAWMPIEEFENAVENSERGI